MALPVLIWEQALEIPGWLFKEEADLLYDLAEDEWCEIGGWKGRSGYVLGSKAKGHTVDWFREGNTLREWEQSVAPVRENITLRAASYRDAVGVVPCGLSLLFLDADHSYDGTLEAFDLYAPKVRSGGHLVLHDAYGLDWETHWWPGVAERLPEKPWEPFHVPYPGVSAAVDAIRWKPEWEWVGQTMTCATFRRR